MSWTLDSPTESKKPSVLFVVSSLKLAGSESKIVRLANALAGAGHVVGIAYLNAPHTLLPLVSEHVQTVDLQRTGKYSIGSLRRLVDIVGHYEFVISVNFYPLLYLLPAIRLGGQVRAKSVCLVNTTEFVDGQWIWGYLYAPFVRRCDRLVYGCYRQLELWRTKYRLAIPESVCIYNGVDVERFDPGATEYVRAEYRNRLGVSEGSVLLGGVGRLAPEKNFESLIRCVARLQESGRDAHVVLAGDGDQQEALENLAADTGVARKCRFVGLLEDVRPVLAAIDVFVLPSRAVETFSNAALEAMAMAKPVVLSRIGGAEEMIEDGESGFLFEWRDENALFRILCKLCDDADARKAIGAAARQRVQRKFEFRHMVAGYQALLSNN